MKQWLNQVIHLRNIPKDLSVADMENSKLFNGLVRIFNKKNWTKYSLEKIKSRASLIKEFEQYVMFMAMTGKIKTCDSEVKTLHNVISIYKQEILFVTRSSTIYYDEIVERLYIAKWFDRYDRKVVDEMLMFVSSYHIVKRAFHWKKRKRKLENWEYERYFTHLQWVMEIVLRELPYPNINKIVIALMHDIIEDTWLNKKVIKKLYWFSISDWVHQLSKRDWIKYINHKEKVIFEILIIKYKKIIKKVWLHEENELQCKLQSVNISNFAKSIDDIISSHKSKLKVIELQSLNDLRSKYIKHLIVVKIRRNDDYFWHLDELDDDILDIKFADRLHNLRTLDWFNKEKVIRKIEETEKYFLSIAELRNKTAYDLLVNEINRLKVVYGLIIPKKNSLI